MSTLRQTCPECSSSLELPAEAWGRLAKCPACDATFRIGASEDVEAKNSETCNSAHSLQLNEIAIEDVLAATWGIFRARWKQSVLPCLIAFFAAVLLVGIPIWVISSIATSGQTLLAAIGAIFLFPYAALLGAFGLLGLCRVHLAIVQGEGDPLKNWKPPNDLMVRFLPGYFLVVLIVIILLGIGVGVVIVSASAAQPQLTKLVGVVTSFAFLVITTTIQWYFWAWMMVASDGKCTALGSLKIASSISQRNKLTSFFVVLIAVVLFLVGSLACYVGHLVTLPLTLILLAVGYLMATNQPIADPSDG